LRTIKCQNYAKLLLQVIYDERIQGNELIKMQRRTKSLLLFDDPQNMKFKLAEREREMSGYQQAEAESIDDSDCNGD